MDKEMFKNVEVLKLEENDPIGKKKYVLNCEKEKVQVKMVKDYNDFELT